MPTKTDRILSYLPGTFRALPKPTALYSVVDAFGSELLQAENSLAELMMAHWVDHADRGAEFIQDLACIAALYGLAPRGATPAPPSLDRPTCLPLAADESVEEFREHLKRYVRTFLDGTVTVQGVLRIVAEALGLHIADAYAEMDTWWMRPDDALVTVEPRGDDAARLLFGSEALTAAGQAAQPARVVGTVDLSGPIDLRGASTLRLKVDATASQDVNLAALVPDPAAATLDQIADAINAALAGPIARADRNRLVLAAPTIGPSSRLEVQDVEGDAALHLIGLMPRVYRGADAVAARVTGTVDLSGGIDLSDARYLRLLVDGTHLAEVDCAGADPAATALDEIVNAVNGALGVAVASHDGQFLKLASPTIGSGGSIAFQRPAAQDATELLFGPVASFYLGRDARPAEVAGARDLSQGANLTAGSKLRIRLNDEPAVEIDCAGADAARTRPSEIVAALNAALGANLAGHDGRFVRLASPTTGPSSTLAFEPLLDGEDAAEAIFGIRPRTFQGLAATRARLAGKVDLSAGVDLGAQHFIGVALDGGPAVEIDVRAHATNSRGATIEEIAAAINAVLGDGVAARDGERLSLTSPTSGSASTVSIQPLEVSRRRRFVTRAFFTDEAAQAIFGFVRQQSHGTAATPARVVGAVDLSRGVDLREAHYLRIALDGQPAQDVDCAAPAHSPRPRAAMPGEIVEAINAALGADVASTDRRTLALASRSSGAGSRIAFEPPRAADASGILLGLEPATFRGRDATRVTFTGTVDLSAGVDLSAADKINIRVDGAPLTEIACAGADPAHTTLNEIVIKINVALNAVVARHDGRRITLTSSLTGTASGIEFAAPAGADATQAIFGIAPPRAYQGADAAPARIAGIRDLGGGSNLGVARFVRVAVAGQPARDVDCAAGAADPAHATLDEIVAAIATALGPGIADHDGAHLILTSTATGAAARLELLPYTSGDARSKLFGDVPDETTGSAPAPATITGSADLLTPVNLAERRLIRLSVDGGRPFDVDVSGAAPESTFLDQIVAKINQVFPGLASATDDDRLRLASPTAGEHSRLELLPLRALEVIEYPPAQVDEAPHVVRHADRWFTDNDGAADSDLVIELSAPQGVVGPALVNRTTGQRIRLMIVVRSGEQVRIWRDPDAGLRAAIVATDGTLHPVPGSHILAGPLGAQAWVPFAGEWRLSGDDDDPATLQLNNPLAPNVVILRARRLGPDGHRISVGVTEAALTPQPLPPVGEGAQRVRLVGRVRVDAAGYRLVNADGATLAHLRGGPGVALDAHRDRVVSVYGSLHLGDDAPLMVVARIADLFDVTLRGPAADGVPIAETYAGVSIGLGGADLYDLTRQITVRSRLVLALEIDKAAALALPRGRSEWTFLDCYAARFDRDRFDAARFAGGQCLERGIFDISRFVHTPPEPEAAVFVSSAAVADPAVEVRFRWSRHQPAAFVVNLPADLPEPFGGRFDQARFGQSGDEVELYDGVVTEPAGDPDHIVAQLAQSKLVEARIVPRVLIGFEAATMPFRRPRERTLSGGSEGEPARLYVAEKDVPGFVEVRAREPGEWGNAIAVTARKSGPARFDVTVRYQAARFENARQVALAGRILKPGEDPLPALAEDLLKPGPVGVVHAKAAGVHADVTRDRTGSAD